MHTVYFQLPTNLCVSCFPWTSACAYSQPSEPFKKMCCVSLVYYILCLNLGLKTNAREHLKCD